jgi:hypothetical protein
VRSWIWEHYRTYTINELLMVCRIPKDRFRNLLYGLGLAFPGRVPTLRRTAKTIPEWDRPPEYSHEDEIPSSWLENALAKYSKNAVATALQMDYIQFAQLLGRRGVPIRPRQAPIDPDLLRTLVIAHNLRPFEIQAVLKRRGNPNFLLDQINKNGIPMPSQQLVQASQRTHRKAEHRAHRRNQSIAAFLSGPQAPVR